MSIKIKRICAGSYKVTKGTDTVYIDRFDHLDYEYGQWVAAANWDRSLYTDPIIYLKDAKQIAKDMLMEVK